MSSSLEGPPPPPAWPGNVGQFTAGGQRLLDNSAFVRSCACLHAGDIPSDNYVVEYPSQLGGHPGPRHVDKNFATPRMCHYKQQHRKVARNWSYSASRCGWFSQILLLTALQVEVSTSDSDAWNTLYSGNPGSSPGKTFVLFFSQCWSLHVYSGFQEVIIL